VQIVILYFKGFLEIGESRSQLFSSSENASKIIVGYSSIFIPFFCESFSLSEKLKSNVEIF
jgi:hypothetical protein